MKIGNKMVEQCRTVDIGTEVRQGIGVHWNGSYATIKFNAQLHATGVSFQIFHQDLWIDLVRYPATKKCLEHRNY